MPDTDTCVKLDNVVKPHRKHILDSQGVQYAKKTSKMIFVDSLQDNRIIVRRSFDLLRVVSVGGQREHCFENGSRDLKPVPWYSKQGPTDLEVRQILV